jgi:hypothetical protein
MNKNKPAAAIRNEKHQSTLQKDAICLVLVVMAVFALHLFSKSTVEQLYKAKEKDNAAASFPTPKAPVF